MTFELASTAFDEQAIIPVRYTCDGENRSPPFNWSGAPEGTKSFLFVCTDPDAPSGIFHHWAAFDIPADWSGLKEGVKSPEPAFRQAVNDFGELGYSGPCPPKRDKPHHYHFQISALSTGVLPAPKSATCAQIMKAARPFVLDSVELIGLYGRAAAAR